MVEESDNIVLEHLRIMRNENQETRTEMRDRFSRIEMRLSSIEHTLGQMYATAGDDRAAMQALTQRVERLERRLELRDDA